MKIKRGWVKVIVILLNCSIVTAAIFIFPKPVEAADLADHLIVNEIYPNPQTNELEWVELYNPTDSIIDLANYRIEDSSGNKFSDLGGKSVVSHGYLFVEDSNVLNNTSDTVFLKINTSIVDQAIFGNWSNLKGKSFARYPNGVDTDNDSQDFVMMMPTKGSGNVKPKYSFDIIINEIVPTPDDGTENEFVELYNSADLPVDLSNWQIDDGEGGSGPYTFLLGTVIEPKSYLVFYNNKTKISFNDSGDSARLIDPNGDIKNSVSYQTGVKGESYSRFGDNWAWSLKLTPESENIFEQKSSPEKGGDTLNITEARKLENGQIVTIEGTVTVVPGVLSANFFYIEDGTGGMQIYNYHKELPSLHVGDRIRVTGELSETAGERRIKTDSPYDIIILSSGEGVEPRGVQVSEIGESLEGQYVKIKGKISQTSGNTFIVEQDGKQIKIIIKSGTGIKKPKMRKGDIVEISGIVSEYKNEYRILPIEQEDVKILASSMLPKVGGSILVYPLIAVIIICANLWCGHARLLWNTFQKMRLKLFPSLKMWPVRPKQEIFLY